MDWKTLFFSAEGRIGRSTFWMGWLILLGVNSVIHFLPLIGQAIALVTVYCWVCVCSKRLHDMGRSGFLQIWPMILCTVLFFGGLVMVAGPAIMAAVTDGDEQAIMAAVFAGLGGMLLAMLASGLIGFGFLLWVGLSAGSAGENRYGAPADTPAIAKTS